MSQESLKSKIEKLKKALEDTDKELRELESYICKAETLLNKKTAIEDEIKTREKELGRYYHFDVDDFDHFLTTGLVHSMIDEIYQLVGGLKRYDISFNYVDAAKTTIEVCTANNDIFQIYIDPDLDNVLIVSSTSLNEKLPLKEVYEIVADWLHYFLKHDTEGEEED